MSSIKRSTATLRIYGDSLDSQHISNLLGCAPTYSVTKGQKIVGEKTGRVRYAKSGMWRVGASDRSPEDIDGQVKEILSGITASVEVWKALSREHRVNLFCGLFMNETNDGMSLSPKTMAALAERGIELWFDIYSPIQDFDAIGVYSAIVPLPSTTPFDHDLAQRTAYLSAYQDGYRTGLTHHNIIFGRPQEGFGEHEMARREGWAAGAETGFGHV
jgi:ribosomal protein L19